MYYFEDPQNREGNVTRDLVRQHLGYVVSALGIEPDGVCFAELQKSVYGAEGDVDLLFFSEPKGKAVSLVACEVKVIYLSPEREISSPKTKKSDKQLTSLERDGFDYVWLIEVIVTQPAPGWLHPQAGEGIFKKTGSVPSSRYGHAKIQITGVNGRLEADAGGLGCRVIQPAERLSENPKRQVLLEHLRVYLNELRRA